MSKEKVIYKTIGEVETNTDWTVESMSGELGRGFVLHIFYASPDDENVDEFEDFTGKTFSECEQELLKWANK